MICLEGRIESSLQLLRSGLDDGIRLMFQIALGRSRKTFDTRPALV